jgi:HEAT repeat protein
MAALTAFGPAAEPLLLELMTVEPADAVNCLHALAVCGTDRARPALARQTEDGRPAVQAAAFEALGRIGLDDMAAGRALAALGHRDPRVRAAAASALGGWGVGETVARLADHLDDTWEVAVRAAQSLRSTGVAGRAALEARSDDAGTAGRLARHMLWLDGVRT